MTDIPDVQTTDSIRVYLKRKGSMLYSKGDYVYTKYDAGWNTDWDRDDPSTIDLFHFDNGVKALEIRENPEKYILHLSYYELNELIDLEPGDASIYIRASSEPFDEEARLDEERMIHWFTHFGVNSDQGHHPIQIHASGHMARPDISKLIKAVKPTVVFPVHTEKHKIFENISKYRVILPELGKKFDI